MELFFLIGFIGALVALLFAQSRRLVVMACPEGNDRMRKIASAIREGANAYLKQQYATVARIFAIVFVILLLMAFGTNGSMLSKFTPFAFLSGGIFSIYRNENLYPGQFPHCQRGVKEPQPGSSCRLCLRFRHGLHRRRTRHTGYLLLVLFTAFYLRNL